MSISKKKQRGFSMIEVLVSLIVIGVGMLGLTGLQIASIKGASNAHSRNVASLLVMEMTDRMRANRAGVAGDFYDNEITCETSGVVQCNDVDNYCTAQETARYDYQEVLCGVTKGDIREGGVANSLLSGELTIENLAAITVGTECFGMTDPNTHRVTVAWSSKKLDQDQQDSVRDQQLQICVIP